LFIFPFIVNLANKTIYKPLRKAHNSIVMSQPKIVLPGDPLGPVANSAPGTGTYVHNDTIFAAIAGTIQTTTSRDPENKAHSIQTLSVALDQSPSDMTSNNESDAIIDNYKSTPRLPSVGTVIYARVTAVQRQQALCSILALQVPATNAVVACEWPFRGILRSQDVRMTEKDRVKMQSSVAVGDVIRAEVVSLGDQGGYYLSTAGNELGVVMAWSKLGNVCVPISWKEVADERTGQREERKVAKPI
jgi:exosome complex component CSL4